MKKEITLIGGPKHRNIIVVQTYMDRILMPVLKGNSISQIIYKRHHGDIFVYDDGKARARLVRQSIEPDPTASIEKTKEKIRENIREFLKQEGCKWYEVLQETFEMTRIGYQGTWEVYIHSGRVLEK